MIFTATQRCLCTAILLSHFSVVARAQDEPTNQSVIDGIHFSLADGLRIEKIAGEALVKWPIVADWDHQGRLVVAESGGVGWPITEHNEKKLHKIVRLVDTDGDGKFDTRIIAADQLAFPEGVLCLGDDILVSAPPVIWKFTDNDGDGVCEDRAVWFDAKTVTNCANDLHGPYLGRDGWIYWCKGAFGQQTHQLLDGRTFESSAAHIYRRRLEGGPIEPVISGGMDNPVEVAFTPEGEKFFTSTFLQHPGGGLRDGIAHAVYGGLFGKEHSVISGHARTGSLMPVMTQLGPAAPSGLICLESNRLARFPKTPTGSRTLVAALFNLQKLTAHQLVADGASYRTIDHDLVVADRVDFHPTDVIEDADGSLLLIDTGGWYDLCCPTSRIDQKTAAGGIYRISSATTDEANVDQNAVDWGSVDTKAATGLLFDQRPWVRRQAGSILRRGGNESIALLTSILNDADRPVDDRLTSLWAVCRIGTENAIELIATQLRGNETSIIQAACHVVSLHRDEHSREDLERLLDHDNLHVRRAAAEALGRVGDAESITKLLHSLQHVRDDRHLEHSLLYALIEISRRQPSAGLMELADSDTRLRAVLIVLDQVGRSEDVQPARLFAALMSDKAELRQAASEILSKQPSRAPGSIERLNGLWSRIDRPDSVAGEMLARIVASWRNQRSVQNLLARWISTIVDANQSQQLFLASNLHDFSMREMLPSWSAPIANWLQHADQPIQRELADSLGRMEMKSPDTAILAETIVFLARHVDAADQRLRLLSALPKSHVLENAALEEEVVSAFLGEDESLLPLASKVLQRIKLSGAGARQLVAALPNVSSRYLMTAVEVVHRSEDHAIDEEMLVGLSTMPTAKTLPQPFLTNLYKQAPKRLREQAQRTTTELLRPPADIQATVEEMLARLRPGDAVRGLQVFRGNKASCSACHRMGYIGKDVGPELTRIGGSRTPAALIEALLFPSARLEQSYQPTRLLTVDGQIHNGLIKRRTSESIELQLNADRFVVVPTEDIELLEPSDVSVMPAGLTELLTIDEISDLMALLRSAK